MNKKILFVLILCAVSSMSFGQGFGAELLLGANFSQVDGDQLGGYNKVGLNAGIQINREINDNWKGAFELRFSMKGAKKVIDPEFPSPTLKLSYHYVEVPLIAKYTYFDRVTPYAGLSLGVNVINERNDNGFLSEEDALRPMEVGVLLGGTYHLTDKIGLDLRHSNSVLSVQDYPVRLTSPTWLGRVGWFNRLFTIGISYTP